MDEITRILNDVDQATASSDELIVAVYHELKRMAANRMAQEAPGHTLQPTALVHEAWMRLADGKPIWNGRGHFYSAAAEAMRRILIEAARRKGRLKRGGEFERIEIDQIELPIPARDDELLAVDEALDRLALLNAGAAQVVKLRFFVGLTQEETARELGVSVSSVERLWGFARAWLYREIHKQAPT